MTLTVIGIISLIVIYMCIYCCRSNSIGGYDTSKSTHSTGWIPLASFNKAVCMKYVGGMCFHVSGKFCRFRCNVMQTKYGVPLFASKGSVGV